MVFTPIDWESGLVLLLISSAKLVTILFRLFEGDRKCGHERLVPGVFSSNGGIVGGVNWAHEC